ncbi:hypothetical protein L208DRAFT_1380572 [Tricholoma matsutake]|nr:hypothetical protein L208DRAFT_1380572 [Tricholoma matsutake 945]
MFATVVILPSNVYTSGGWLLSSSAANLNSEKGASAYLFLCHLFFAGLARVALNWITKEQSQFQCKMALRNEGFLECLADSRQVFSQVHVSQDHFLLNLEPEFLIVAIGISLTTSGLEVLTLAKDMDRDKITERGSYCSPGRRHDPQKVMDAEVTKADGAFGLHNDEVV